MLPPAIIIHGTTGIEHFGGIIQRADVVALRYTAVQISIPPAFIDGRPGHDARMVAIALHGLCPLGAESRGVFGAEGVCVRDLAPYEIPEGVGEIEE